MARGKFRRTGRRKRFKNKGRRGKGSGKMSRIAKRTFKREWNKKVEHKLYVV